jgi:hypothetical protein
MRIYLKNTSIYFFIICATFIKNPKSFLFMLIYPWPNYRNIIFLLILKKYNILDYIPT